MATSPTLLQAIKILLTASLIILAGITLALPGPTDAAAISKEAEKQPDNSQQDNTQQGSGGLMSRINQTTPNLEQALIIFTSFNAILIVFGAIALVLKNRMEDESASALASIKATQSRIPQES